MESSAPPASASPDVSAASAVAAREQSYRAETAVFSPNPAESSWVLQVELFGPLAIKILVLGILGYALIGQMRRLHGLTEPPRFESHWGGLGRGLGGWRINFSFVHALLAALLVLGFLGFSLFAIAPTEAPIDGKDHASPTVAVRPSSETGTLAKKGMKSSSD